MPKKLPEPTSSDFLRGYLVAALWSSNDNSDDSGGEPLDKNYSIDDISDESLAKAISDVNKFIKENRAALDGTGADDDQNGHDFWLTRNRHGVGFWDRNYGEVGDTLTEASHKFGEVYAYVGDDGKIYFDRG